MTNSIRSIFHDFGVTYPVHSREEREQALDKAEAAIDAYVEEREKAAEVAFARKVLAVSSGVRKLRGLTQSKRLKIITDKCMEAIPGELVEAEIVTSEGFMRKRGRHTQHCWDRSDSYCVCPESVKLERRGK